jgi:hypothetical protein
MESKNPKINCVKQLILGASTALTLFTGRIVAASNPAVDGAEAARPDGVPSDLVGPTGLLTDITSKILYVVGIISVFMLIYGGIRYIISGGDAKKVTEAKNTLLYAVIGLIIAVLAFAIVRFILTALGAPAATEGVAE